MTIRETKAPDGYLTEDEVVVRKILPEGTAEAVCTYEPVEVAEQVIRGDIELIKFREDTDPETEHKTPLEGIEFSLTAKSTGEVFKIVTDEKVMQRQSNQEKMQGEILSMILILSMK